MKLVIAEYDLGPPGIDQRANPLEHTAIVGSAVDEIPREPEREVLIESRLGPRDQRVELVGAALDVAYEDPLHAIATP